MALFVVSLLALSLVSAAPSVSTLGGLTLDGVSVEINDDEAGDTLLVFEEGETLDIEVELEIEDDGDDNVDSSARKIEVVARLSGYEYSDYEELEASSHVFDVREGTRKSVNLELDLPRDLDNGENTLRVFVLDRNSEELVKTFEFEVESPRHSVDIKDVVFSPGNTVKAGRSLLATVLVENYGDRDEEDVKVSVDIPELGVKATKFISELDAEDSEDVFGDYEGGLILPIPADAAGDYEVVISVAYDDLRETVSESYTLHVLANDMFQHTDRLVLAVGPEMQNVAAGSSAVYAVALTNAGTSSKAYTLEVATGDWASASLSDSLVVLEPGKNKVVYVEVTAAADAVAGEHVASLTISSGDESLETIALKANVMQNNAASAGKDLSLRNGLEIALIVLVVLLVIIGLIVGFSRLRKDEDDEQAYY